MSKPLAAKSVGACLGHVLNRPAHLGRVVSPRGRRFDGKVEHLCTHLAPICSGILCMRLILNGPEAAASAKQRDAEVSALETRKPIARVDAGLLGSLYRDHSPRLRRYFSRRGSAANAEDLVQETFVRLAGAKARKPVVIEQPSAYLNQIAGNLLREQARFAVRRSSALHTSDDTIQLSGPDPVGQLEARDMLSRLEAAMATMKPATREIFMAHRIDGYTYSEIAKLKGRTVKSVERHIAKAVFQLSRAMRRF